MKVEVSTAADFISEKLIGERLPQCQRDDLRASLSQRLLERYEDHWYPQNPLLGSGYRAIQLCGGRLDRELQFALSDAGVAGEQLAKLLVMLPGEFWVFCDPFEVAVRIGAEGSVWCLELIGAPTKYQKQPVKSQHTSYMSDTSVSVSIDSFTASLSADPDNSTSTPSTPQRPNAIEITPRKVQSASQSRAMAITPGGAVSPLTSRSWNQQQYSPSRPMAITPAKPGAPNVTPRKSMAPPWLDPNWGGEPPELRRKMSLSDISNMATSGSI